MLAGRKSKLPAGLLGGATVELSAVVQLAVVLVPLVVQLSAFYLRENFEIFCLKSIGPSRSVFSSGGGMISTLRNNNPK